MKRTDIEGYVGPGGRRETEDKVTLVGNGREAELIVTALRVLSGTIAVRDATTRQGRTESQYGTGRREQGNGVPLIGEVTELIAQLEKPNYVTKTPERVEIPIS